MTLDSVTSIKRNYVEKKKRVRRKLTPAVERLAALEANGKKIITRLRDGREISLKRISLKRMFTTVFP